MDAEPRVSVVAVCYNHARFLSESLSSIQRQDYSNLQVLVVDDASPDGSGELLREWIDRHELDWHLVVHTRNVGPSATLNELIALADGKYVAMLATDDVWLPHKLRDQVRQLENLPDSVGVVYSDAGLIDVDGAALPGRFIETYRPQGAVGGDLFRELLTTNFIPGPGALMRRSVLEATGGFDEALAYEDWDFWLRVADRFAFEVTPQITALYRIVPRSLFRSLGDEALESHLEMYLKWLGRRPHDEQVVRMHVRRWARDLYRVRGWSGLRYGLMWLRYGGADIAIRSAVRRLRLGS